MTEEQKQEIRDVLRSIATHVTEARCLSEELENVSRDDGIEDEHLEAECYDWSAALADVETRVDEWIAENYPEDEA